MKKQIITIAGALGAGKSSTAKLVARSLGYTHFSSGDLFRTIAQERGVSIEEINKIASLEAEIDRAVDEQLRALGESEKLVIDSRLAFHWIPNSFKVYLDLEVTQAAERIFTQMQSEGRMSQHASSVEEVLTTTRSRREDERQRYLRLYQVDTADLAPFDLVINTGEHDLETVVHMIITNYQNRID